MIKAVATDLDGTLFYPRKKKRLLSKANRQFVQNVLGKGKEVILVTGRNYNAAQKVEKAIKMDKSLSVVACDGAVIMHQDEILKEEYLTGQEALELYEELSKDKHIKSWMFFCNTQIMLVEPSGLNLFEKIAGIIGLNTQGAYSEPFIVGKKKIIKYLQNPEVRVYKIMPWYGYRKISDIRARDASINWTKQYGHKYEFAWTHDAVEIMKYGVNKADSLKELLKILGIENDEVLVVGDSGNDVPLFKAFKNSFVMAHAPEEIKKEAKIVVESVADLKDYIE